MKKFKIGLLMALFAIAFVAVGYYTTEKLGSTPSTVVLTDSVEVAQVGPLYVCAQCHEVQPGFSCPGLPEGDGLSGPGLLAVTENTLSVPPVQQLALMNRGDVGTIGWNGKSCKACHQYVEPYKSSLLCRDIYGGGGTS